MTEEERVAKFLQDGYKVEVVNPTSQKFNEKYSVYKDFPIGKRYAILDEEGNAIAEQG